MRRLALLLVVPMVLAGCAGYDNLSGAQKGGLIGAGTGAAAGAIIGNQVGGNRSGHAGTGAIIGALGGAAAGALIGDAMEKKPNPSGPDRGQLQPVPPPTQASVTVPGQYPADPTRGRLVNSTPFRVQVYIDADPTRGGTSGYSMNPNEVLPVNLDVGPHRIVAVATRDTQFGQRTVGQLDRPVNVDVRGSGWEMRFNEGDFR
ncbi:MAG TPA: glycine zipper domain-containing protein [Candidatus Acidoferrum sp.]|nr:glycine zipper domain-containing protein [Candidatus Acidoferrum sp.]